ncbi:MAG: NADP-specific glutamate dehydrogenase [Phycisphaerae bacterium]|jgi:glutamate dehydrogenase (NADP+)
MGSYFVDKVMEDVVARNPTETQFHSAVQQVLQSIEPVIGKHPEFAKAKIAERVVEPERQIIFRLPWVDDHGEIQVNRGFRIGFNSAVGPYKGGLRFHPTVDLDTVKFLAFEQVFKGALTGMQLGGGKGGSDFDPKGKSDMEVMRFCQGFMNELFRHVGPDTDIPAGDIGVSMREIGYLFGQYKKLTNTFTGVLTNKGLDYGGSPVRAEATGYGLVYFVSCMLAAHHTDWKGKRVLVSGSGNVAIHAAEKAQQLGAVVVAMSDSDGYVVDAGGIDLDGVKEIKRARQGRIHDYVAGHGTAAYHEGSEGIWKVPCDVAMPCATEGELDEAAARTLVAHGCRVVAEGANKPSTEGAIRVFKDAGVAFAPSKAANSGGVAISALEMSQNATRLTWTFEEVDARLNRIMSAVYDRCLAAAEAYGASQDLTAGANIAGFLTVARAMLAQGVV